VKHVASTGDRRDVSTFFVERPEGKILLGIPWCRWYNSVMTDFHEVAWGGRHCIDLEQVRDV
jgi:hypothetical protein